MKIKRFIECLVPVTMCNLNCAYCYVIQQDRRTKRLPEFKYNPEMIGSALSKDRLGGTAYLSICGAGETLIPKEITTIVYQLLRNEHYVNVTTNGTFTNKYMEIIELPKEYLTRLHFSFSFHYLELKKIGKVEQFFYNVNLVKEAGCSILVQFNLCDEYITYLEDIKQLCIKHVGALPQVAATRDERSSEISLMTKLDRNKYKELGSDFASPLFEFTMKNFMIKRKEFCYAGDWSATLNLCTGEMKKCYASRQSQNIFQDISKPIKFEALGNNCRSPYCMNSSHFMALGVIPGMENPSYAGLRDKPEASWYTPQMRTFLDGKLANNNTEYSKLKKLYVNNKEFLTSTLLRKSTLRSIARVVLKKLVLLNIIKKSLKKI